MVGERSIVTDDAHERLSEYVSRVAMTGGRVVGFVYQEASPDGIYTSLFVGSVKYV